MKKNLPLILILLSTTAFAQNSGSIVPQVQKPQAGKENVFIYTPPKDLEISDSAKAYILYVVRSPVIKKIYLRKDAEQKYHFSVATPGSTPFLFFAIADKNDEIIDNNNSLGYISYLYNNNEEPFPGARIYAAISLNYYGRYLKLQVPPDTLIKLFEHDYNSNPSFKTDKGNNYPEYLRVLYAAKKDSAKPQLLSYIKEQTAIDSEQNWNNAKTVYQVLRMNGQADSLNTIMISKWPYGDAAKIAALDSIYQAQSIDKKINLFNDFRTHFSLDNYDRIYSSILAGYANEKDWDKYIVYADSVKDKSAVAALHNKIAWAFSGEDINSSGENLELAKELSKKSMDIMSAEMSNPEKYKPEYISDIEAYKQQAKNNYDAYADTYALLLFKLNQVDSAFYYQSIAVQNSTDAGSYERYAAYAAKTKGNGFAKQFLENKLLQGYTSIGMKTRLKGIYKEMNLSDADYNTFITKANTAYIEKINSELEGKMNSPAKSFSLKNLKGETISLASLKGKVVVLDFWATWCGPCKVSFPAMQKAVEKFKDDKDVAFLFIDTWENKEPKQMQKDAQTFISTNKYSFNVLLDSDDKTITDYEVNGIPTKFIINKKGNIQFMSVGFGGDVDGVVDEIATMIDIAKNG